MPLPSSGAISLNDVNVELGNTATAQISMNDAAVRTLFQVASGAISMSDGYGKSNSFSTTITSNQVDLDLRTYAVNAGWDESSALEVTIDTGIVCSASTTGVYGLYVSGSFPGGVTLINNGYILGRGGNGGSGYIGYIQYANGYSGGGGGPALYVSASVTIDNTNGTIGGGGGGGGGGGAAVVNGYNLSATGGGSGGGGGRSNAGYNSSGGNGGYAYAQTTAYGIAGNAGTYNAAGNGGGYTYKYSDQTGQYARGGAGGNGGNWGAGGNSGANGYYSNAYGVSKSGGGGGGGGSAVVGNSYITWTATGTRYGGIS